MPRSSATTWPKPPTIESRVSPSRIWASSSEGVRFSNSYTNCPVSMPARSTFLSGLFCHNHGQWDNYGHLPADEHELVAQGPEAPGDGQEERAIGTERRAHPASSPSAARSLEEGLEETLTVTRLGLHESLVRTFSSTNLIESCFARTQSWTSRVKRWRGAKMVLRWGAAALLFAEKGFRRVRGYDHMNQLIQALQSHHSQLAPVSKAA